MTKGILSPSRLPIPSHRPVFLFIAQVSVKRKDFFGLRRCAKSDALGDCKRDLQFVEAVIGADERVVFVGRRVEHVAGGQEGIERKAVEIAHRLDARDLHFDRKAALASAGFELIARLAVEGVGRPDASLDVRQLQLPEDRFRAVRLLDRDIVLWRRVVIGQTFVAVRFGGNDVFPLGRRAVQAARRAEQDKRCRAGHPVEFDDLIARKRRPDPAQRDRKRFARMLEQIDRPRAVCGIQRTGLAHGKARLQLPEDHIGKGENAGVAKMPLRTEKRSRTEQRLGLVVKGMDDHRLST